MRFQVQGIGKAFGSTAALIGADLELAPGRIHALLGENGAGKSTLMRIAAGAEQPNSGQMRLDGGPYAPRAPLDARRAGVAIVYQELSVCPHLSVLENIVLGVESRRFGWVSRRDALDRVDRALSLVPELRARLELDQLVLTLSSAERQLVEIARALTARSPRLLILDEPTSSLGQADVDTLFRALDALRARGLSILYVSHFLEEVRRIADDYTVLRDGRSVASGRIQDTSNEALVAEMAGRAVETKQFADRPRGELLLEGVELSSDSLPVSASFQLFRGEILGIAGLVGSGRSELLRALFGLSAIRSGQLKFSHFEGPAAPATRLQQGMGFLSEDRKGEGLALSLSIAQNLTLSKLAPLTRAGLVSEARERSVAEQWVERLGVRCASVSQRVGELSGGNQQKVALGRLLYHDVDVLLLDEPTRGVDVRSRGDVHELITNLAAQGKAVLLVSSQLPELFSVCDRIAVMHRGRLGEARPRRALSEHDVLMQATGVA